MASSVRPRVAVELGISFCGIFGVEATVGLGAMGAEGTLTSSASDSFDEVRSGAL